MSTSATSPVINRPPIETSMEVLRHELFQDLAEQCARRLIEKHGIDLEVGLDTGNAIADFLADHWSGQNIYFPADTQHRQSKRDLEIYQKMERGKANRIGLEYGISPMRVYQVYKRIRTQMIKRLQPGLFDDSTLPPLVSVEDAFKDEEINDAD